MEPMEMVNLQRSKSHLQRSCRFCRPPHLRRALLSKPNLATQNAGCDSSELLLTKADHLPVPPVGPGSLLAVRSVSAAESGSHKLQNASCYRFAHKLHPFT